MIQSQNLALLDLRVEDISAYVNQQGWQLVPHPNNKILVFEGPADDFGRPLDLVLPRRNDYVDSRERLADAVNLLSAVRDTSPENIIDEIRTVDRDVLGMRVIGSAVAQSSISLELAVRFIQGLRNLVAFAACAEEDPKPYFIKAPSIGKRHAERCRFGHTFHGSFGFTVESPIAPPVQLPLPGLSQSSPFQRRVMERVIRGFASAQESTLTGNVDLLIKNYRTGFNANMCEAALEMSGEVPQTDLEYTIRWSPEWPVPDELQTLSPIQVQSKTYQYLEATARELRRVEQAKETAITGRIVQLRAEELPAEEDDEDDGIPRLAVVAWETNGGQLRVRVPLELEQYREACDAHRDGHTISVSGWLEKTGKFWTLMRPFKFAVC